MISDFGMSQKSAHQKNQPWMPADATDSIRTIAQDSTMTLDLTSHARQQMEDRDLIVSDVLHVLKNGFVYENAAPATREGCYKYQIETTSPAGSRVVRVIAIPCAKPAEIKIVTVMWRDEVPH
jgi:hypothetical protein